MKSSNVVVSVGLLQKRKNVSENGRSYWSPCTSWKRIDKIGGVRVKNCVAEWAGGGGEDIIDFLSDNEASVFRKVVSFVFKAV